MHSQNKLYKWTWEAVKIAEKQELDDITKWVEEDRTKVAEADIQFEQTQEWLAIQKRKRNELFHAQEKMTDSHFWMLPSSLVGTCLTLPNLGFLWVFFKYPKISKNGNLLFFPVMKSSSITKWNSTNYRLNCSWTCTQWSSDCLSSHTALFLYLSRF